MLDETRSPDWEDPRRVFRELAAALDHRDPEAGRRYLELVLAQASDPTGGLAVEARRRLATLAMEAGDLAGAEDSLAKLPAARAPGHLEVIDRALPWLQLRLLQRAPASEGKALVEELQAVGVASEDLEWILLYLRLWSGEGTQEDEEGLRQDLAKACEVPPEGAGPRFSAWGALGHYLLARRAGAAGRESDGGPHRAALEALDHDYARELLGDLDRARGAPGG